MKSLHTFFFLFVVATSKLTLATPISSSKETKNVAGKQRLEIFKRSLAYLPSLLLSAMDKARLSQHEAQMLMALFQVSAANLGEGSGELVYPENYKIFKVEGTFDQSYFRELEPGLPTRMASTRPHPAPMNEPILINLKQAHDPTIEITVPEAIQILIHEIGWKIPTNLHDKMKMQIVDSLAAKVRRVLDQNYQVIEIGGQDRLHLLNSPISLELPQIGTDDKNPAFKESLDRLKALKVRMGRELLIFFEEPSGFTYVASLKEPLLRDFSSIKNLERSADKSNLFVSKINVEQIRVDRAVTKNPLVRLIMSISERAYRVVDETTDKEKDENGNPKKTGQKVLHSFSALNGQGVSVDVGDEMLSTRLEMTILKEPTSPTLYVSRRAVLPSEPLIQVQNLKWSEQDGFRTGQFTITLPEDRAKSLLTHDLRAYLLARLEQGLARIEVTRLFPNKNELYVDFRIPAPSSTTQSFSIEEVILKNSQTEFTLDLPETLVVRNPGLRAQPLNFVQMNLIQPNGMLSEIKVERGTDDDLKATNDRLDKLHEVPGALKLGNGPQKIRVHFKSQSLLHEIYFYLRSAYLTHDPMTRAGLEELAQIPLFGSAIAKVEGLAFQSSSHMQLIDSVVHIPASQMKQTLSGSDLWIEFEMKMNVMPDKGPNTFDTGLRYFAKIIAVNQRLERWRVDGLRYPLFVVPGTSAGARSCSDLFRK